jgi:formate dehydrogenase subunit delta
MDPQTPYHGKEIDNLVAMANRIGDFFVAMPDPDQARKDIADHLRRFWEPRMRRTMLGHIDAGGLGLRPIVAQAIRENYEYLKPKTPA